MLYSLRRLYGHFSTLRPTKTTIFPYNFVGYKVNFGYEPKIAKNLVFGLISDVDCITVFMLCISCLTIVFDSHRHSKNKFRKVKKKKKLI